MDTVVNARPDLLDLIARMLMTAQNQCIRVRMVEPVLMVTIHTFASALETIEDQHVHSVNILQHKKRLWSASVSVSISVFGWSLISFS